MHRIFDDKKYIFIDMGNTLLDYHQHLTDDEKDTIGLNKMSDYLQSLGMTLTAHGIREKFLDKLYGQFHLREEQLIEIDVYKIIRSFLRLEPNQEDELLRCFYSAYREHIVVHEGARALLQSLKEHQKFIGIISNCYLPAFLYEEIFEDQGLDDYIDSYTFSYTYGIRKPNPILFSKAFVYDNDQSIMIGDGFKPDILGSSNLGIESIWYNHKKCPHKKAECLRLTVTSLTELL